MRYDFDTPVDRGGTWSVRWDRYAGRDVLPLWVADMDFRAPAPVIEALSARVAHGVFGYTAVPQALGQAVIERLERLYRWKVEQEWLVFLPGVVAGLHLAVRQLTGPQDRILFPKPVYNHFKRAAELAPRAWEEVPLCLDDGHWVLDQEKLEEACERGVRLLLFCNPQNPGGSLYTRGELERIAALAERHDFILCSDEIHADLVLDSDKRHVPIASLGREISRRTVTLLSPNKSFNIPSAGCAFAVIENAALRRRFRHELHALVSDPSVFGYAAALAAYTHPECASWLAALLEYLRANRDAVEHAVPAISGLGLAHVEATCLAWIDARGWNIPDPEAHLLEHGLALSPGALFGSPGFVRLNFGTQRGNVEQAMERLRAASRALAAR